MNVALLAGGPSAEHEVSLQSGANMLGVLRGGPHVVRAVFIDRQNRWRFGSARCTLDELAASAAPPLTVQDALAELRRAGEVACLALHGRFGEDGQIQRLFEQAGVPFTGSGSHASAIAMDKDLSKLAATKLGAHTAAHEIAGPGKVPVARLTRVVGLPCFVKPVRSGSSVGVTRVRVAEELQAAVSRAALEDDKGEAMVEAATPGTEVTCAVLRLRDSRRCLPLVAIRPAGDAFYDYNAKYVAEDTRLQCPAQLEPATREEIERVALALHEALELRGVPRVDFIVRPDGVPVFLEVNTLPGFTSHSLVPLAARTAGLPALEVLESCLREALEATPIARGTP